MEVQKLDPFGYDISGLKIEDMREEEMKTVRGLIAEEGVIVLRNQEIDDDDFANFLSLFGELDFTKGMEAVPGRHDLNLVSNKGRTTKPRSVFHTDTSYISNPPSFTALRAVELPERGGETLFSDQFAAFENLGEEVRERFAKATVKHSATGVTLEEEDESSTRHPLFRKHPESGRISIFLSTPERCCELSGLSEEESKHWIEKLFAHSTAEERLLRHRWQSGDVVIWDNRSTLHRADHSDVVGDRVLHRAMVRGEAPLAAF